MPQFNPQSSITDPNIIVWSSVFDFLNLGLILVYFCEQKGPTLNGKMMGSMSKSAIIIDLRGIHVNDAMIFSTSIVFPSLRNSFALSMLPRPASLFYGLGLSLLTVFVELPTKKCSDK